jgi:hypothetical protein
VNLPPEPARAGARIAMQPSTRTGTTLTALGVVLIGMAVAFTLDSASPPPDLPPLPLVAPEFLTVATSRTNLAELTRQNADLSDFDCYACHDRKQPPPLRFDADHNLIIPKEHSNIVMGHGRHNRNNLCFNCHDEANLELLQTRDGRELKLAASTPLCGSCHGPTYRDWDAGVHGRTSGHWDRQRGPSDRQDCTACHDPHSPHFPPRQAAPGPHPLRAPTTRAAAAPASH